MNQTILRSFIEALFNVLIGFGINFGANLIILPMVGFNISLGDNLYIGFLYTIISVVRSYIVRRWFNDKLHKMALKLAAIKE